MRPGLKIVAYIHNELVYEMPEDGIRRQEFRQSGKPAGMNLAFCSDVSRTAATKSTGAAQAHE